MSSKKLIALVSGGLDSTLAMLIAKRMGFDIVPVHIVTPFNDPCCRDIGFLNKVLEREKLRLKTVIVGKEYVDMVRSPKYGYGRAMNPCIDCRIFFFKIAKKIMEEEGAAGIVTGEVLDQRPKSQNLKAIRIIEEESGLTGRVLRPLSGKILKPTKLIEEGLIREDQLLSIRGRSRKRQIELARSFGLTDYPNPSGGCLLTYEPYARKLKDVFENDDSYTMTEIYLLKIGRHFRLSRNTKLIVGKNEEENRILESTVGYIKLIPKNCKGPVGLFRGDPDKLEMAARIVASYCDGPEGFKVVFVIERDDSSEEVAVVKEKKEIFRDLLVSSATR